MTYTTSDDGILTCRTCGPDFVQFDPTRPARETYDDEGFVVEFTEFYVCSNCGGTGALHVDQRGDHLHQQKTGIFERDV